MEPTSNVRGIAIAFAICYAIGNIALIGFGALWFGAMSRGGWLLMAFLVALLLCLVPVPSPRSIRLVIARIVAVAALGFIIWLLWTMEPLYRGQYDLGHAFFLAQLAAVVLVMPLVMVKGKRSSAI